MSTTASYSLNKAKWFERL